MPLEHALWRIGNSLARLPVAKMDTEDLLEDYIFRDITILTDGWLIIGRQVPDGFWASSLTFWRLMKRAL